MRTTEAQMTTWRAEVLDLLAVGPVVNRLQFDVAEVRDLAGVYSWRCGLRLHG